MRPRRAAARPALKGARQGARGCGGAGSATDTVAAATPCASPAPSAPATALHVGPRLDADEPIGEAVEPAADRGIPAVEAGRERA